MPFYSYHSQNCQIFPSPQQQKLKAFPLDDSAAGSFLPDRFVSNSEHSDEEQEDQESPDDYISYRSAAIDENTIRHFTQTFSFSSTEECPDSPSSSSSESPPKVL